MNLPTRFQQRVRNLVQQFVIFLRYPTPSPPLGLRELPPLHTGSRQKKGQFFMGSGVGGLQAQNRPVFQLCPCYSSDRRPLPQWLASQENKGSRRGLAQVWREEFALPKAFV